MKKTIISIYFSSIALSVFSLLLLALIQQIMIFGMEFKFSFLFLPSVVGLALGILISRIRVLSLKLDQAASTDLLTGLYNRRWLYDHTFQEFENAKRYKHKLSVVLFDIDRFKEINDKFGHTTGDIVLKELAEILESSGRAADTYVRWGGEEFISVYPFTDIKGAYTKAEKLRKEIQSQVFTDTETMTCSFGVAEIRDSDRSIDDIISRADKALYRAKEKGRNRVEKSV